RGDRKNASEWVIFLRPMLQAWISQECPSKPEAPARELPKNLLPARELGLGLSLPQRDSECCRRALSGLAFNLKGTADRFQSSPDAGEAETGRQGDFVFDLSGIVPCALVSHFNLQPAAGLPLCP